jgi:hypothetical protein
VRINIYTLTHDQGATQIVFFPNRPCPILHGQPATGPELTYKGPEGSFTFFSDKIANGIGQALNNNNSMLDATFTV